MWCWLGGTLFGPVQSCKWQAAQEFSADHIYEPHVIFAGQVKSLANELAECKRKTPALHSTRVSASSSSAGQQRSRELSQFSLAAHAD